MITATANKQTKTSPVGIKLWATPDGKQIVIVFLEGHGIFARCGLKVGMTLNRVNDVHCSGMSLSEVYSILEDSVGPVTIIANAPSLPVPSSDLPDLQVVEASDSSDENETECRRVTSETDDYQEFLVLPLLEMVPFLDRVINAIFCD